MVGTPVDNTLAISHIRDEAEVSSLMEMANTTEGLRRYHCLLLRRLHFDHTLGASLWKVLQERKGSEFQWDVVELRELEGDLTMAVNICMTFDVVEEFKLVLNTTDVALGAWFAIGLGMKLNTRLSSLYVTTTISGSGMRTLAEGLQMTSSLKRLDFSWSTLDGEDPVDALGSGLRANTSLVDMSFLGCRLSDSQAARVLRALQEHPSIESLNFSGSQIGWQATTALCDLLVAGRQTLQHLDLGFAPPNEDGIDIERVSEALRSNTSLKSLDLSNGNINDDDVRFLGGALCHGSTLTELRIARNKITDEGMRSLAEMLPKMKVLRRLDLWGNPFDDVGAEALAVGLEANWVLEELDLFRNFPCTPRIAFYTALNRGGRKLLHASPSIPLGLWPNVLHRLQPGSRRNSSAISAADLIFYMLQGPVLFQAR